MDGFQVAVLGATVVSNIVLALLALRRNTRSATNNIFALLNTVFALWAVATFFGVNATTKVEALWWTRAVMLLAVPQAVLFMLLMYTFPRTTIPVSRKRLVIIGVVSVIVGMFTMSPFVFTDVNFTPGQAPQPVPGVGMAVFMPWAVGCVALGMWVLIRKTIKSIGIERTQFKYLLTGTLVMFSLIIALSFIGVVFFKKSFLASYGPLFTLPFVTITAYTIVRHRLMDIRLALFRGLSFTILIGGLLGVYGLMVIFAVPRLAELFDISGNILAAGAALISIPIAQYIQQRLIRVTDKFLFQSRVDYSKALVEIGKELSGTIDIEEVSDTVLEIMESTLRTRKAVILLWDEENLEYVPHGSFGVGRFDIAIQAAHPLVSDLRTHGGVLIKDEEKIAAETEINPLRQKQEKAVLDSFEWLDVAAVVPLFVNKELTGIILLGEKISGDPFLQSDADFLNALAPQAATALENARLYKQSLEFGERLKKEVQRATHELETANVQLKNLDKAKSEFLSIASHQLYTPLTALRGYVSMLAEGDFGEVPDKQKEVLNILEKSATRLIDLIKNLLDISRIESGRLELNLESADMVEMGKELVADLMPNAMNKDLKLEFHEPRTAISTVVVDRQRIRQVMLNLIDNAIKYTPKGRVDVRVWQVGDYVTFTVKDTGKGIKREELARLFNKFSRVGGSARFHTEGTGLGLYVARQIVKEHHGEVQVDSPGEGQGSTFSMQLPAEGTSQSLKPGEKAEVVIKAAEAAPAK